MIAQSFKNLFYAFELKKRKNDFLNFNGFVPQIETKKNSCQYPVINYPAPALLQYKNAAILTRLNLLAKFVAL